MAENPIDGFEDSCNTPVKVGGVGAELMNFFLRENAKQLDSGGYVPRTLDDFLDECPRRHQEQHTDLGLEVRRFCHNLIGEALLYSVGFDLDGELPYNERFVSFHFFEELASYGSYDFVALGGFPEVRRHFESSVIRLGVLEDDAEKEMWGSSFLVENNRMVTALHCLSPGSRITIDGWNSCDSELESIKTFGMTDPSRPALLTRSKIDLALLQFKSDPFPTAPKFKLWGASVLDDTLVMGYPQMMGFPPVLVSATGQIVGEHMSSARNQALILVNARVKGGNSGGPVLNRLGKVLGVVTNALTNEELEFDMLGFGLATPAQRVLDLIRACDKNSDEIYGIPHNVDEEGRIRIPRR